MILVNPPWKARVGGLSSQYRLRPAACMRALGSAGALLCTGTLARDSAMRDVTTKVEFIPVDFFRQLIGSFLCLGDGLAQAGGTQYAPAVGQDLVRGLILLVEAGAGVEYLAGQLG